jgi:hypothetical protein
MISAFEKQLASVPAHTELAQTSASMKGRRQERQSAKWEHVRARPKHWWQQIWMSNDSCLSSHPVTVQTTLPVDAVTTCSLSLGAAGSGAVFASTVVTHTHCVSVGQSLLQLSALMHA